MLEKTSFVQIGPSDANVAFHETGSILASVEANDVHLMTAMKRAMKHYSHELQFSNFSLLFFSEHRASCLLLSPSIRPLLLPVIAHC